MVRVVRAGLLAALVGCGFDSSKLDSLECEQTTDCNAPDLACIDGYCVARACADYRDCGDGFRFSCELGLCEASACRASGECAAGFDCVNGYCSGATCREQPDADGDGFIPFECGGRDCDDEDPDASPDAIEDSSVDDATCRDGKDNDCDEVTDDDDAGCRCLLDSDCEDGNPCSEDRCSDGGCLRSVLDGAMCDDQDSCTSGDRCMDESCAGESYSCSDGLDCTAEQCDGAGGCENTLTEGFCVIDDVCRAGGEANPTNACERCDPAVSATQWSLDVEALDDGVACTVDTCEGGLAVHTPDDGVCGPARVCAPCAATEDGCITPPSGIDLSCDPTSPVGDTGAHCSIEVLGSDLDVVGCLSCAAQVGITELAVEDFEDCPDLEARGWTTVGAMRCPIEIGEALDGPGQAALEIEGGSFTMSRTFDTTDLDVVRLCADYADHDASADDLIQVQIDTDGSFDTIFEDSEGPLAGADDTWVTRCVELTVADPIAADNPALGVRLRVSATGEGEKVYLDNITLEGWQAAYVSHPAPLFEDGFAACGLDSWTVEGALGCPVEAGMLAGREAAQVRGSPATLNRTVDMSAVCGDLALSFAYMAVGADPSNAISVTLDVGLGPIEAWAGAVGADASVQDVTVRLSRVVPVLFPVDDIGLSLVLDPGQESTLIVDDVELTGASCAPGDPDVAVSGIERHGSPYEINISSAIRTRAYLTCQWDGRRELGDRASLDFVP